MVLPPGEFALAVVDDDEGFCRSLTRLLRAEGFPVTAYPSAEAFLADPGFDRFGCLILDVELDGMSGLDLQKEIGRRPVSTPIVFLTAHDDAATREGAESHHCLAFLGKHVPADQILAALKRAREAA